MNSDKTKIRAMLDEGPKCSGQILELFKQLYGETIIDYRARISSIRKDLAKDGLTVHHEPCKGQCGKQHDSPVHRYWIGKTEPIFEYFNSPEVVKRREFCCKENWTTGICNLKCFKVKSFPVKQEIKQGLLNI